MHPQVVVGGDGVDDVVAEGARDRADRQDGAAGRELLPGVGGALRCSITPLLPTAKTSAGPLPHTPKQTPAAPAGWAAQEAPSFCEYKIVPLRPTANSSPAPVPHTPKRACVLPEGWAAQE